MGFKLNLGCYTIQFGHNWLNIDILNLPHLYEHAQRTGCHFMSLDVRYGLPWSDGTADYLFSSHMIEHLTYEEGERLMKECYRILKPGGAMRIAVPDVRKMAEAYLNNECTNWDAFNEPCKTSKSQAERFWRVLTHDHKAAYDFQAMSVLCQGAGFQNIQKREYNEGLPVFMEETKDLFPEISLYVEVIK